MQLATTTKHRKDRTREYPLQAEEYSSIEPIPTSYQFFLKNLDCAEGKKRRWHEKGKKKALPFEGKVFTTKSESAATYSPTKLPWQYHRR